MIQTKPVTTFAELVELEPRLRELEADVIAFSATVTDPADNSPLDAWHGQFGFRGVGFKARYQALVGHMRILPGRLTSDSAIIARPKGTITIRKAIERRIRENQALAEEIEKLSPAEQMRERSLRDHVAYDVGFNHLFAILMQSGHPKQLLVA